VTGKKDSRPRKTKA